jgi:hypothetical protein
LALDPQGKGKLMNIRAILCAASGAVLTTLPQAAVAQQGVKIGALSCEVSGGLGFIIASSKEMNCLFTSASGQSEPYSGTIRKFGLDIGATDKGVLAWDVFAPSAGPDAGRSPVTMPASALRRLSGPGLARTRSWAALAARLHCSPCQFKRRPASISPAALRS